MSIKGQDPAIRYGGEELRIVPRMLGCEARKLAENIAREPASETPNP